MTMLYPTFTYPFSVYPLFLFSSNITFYLIFYNQWNHFLFFKVDGSSHFCVCSLRPIQRASLHDHGHPDHRFASFCVQFVPTCSLTCSELPSMLLFTALHSFLAFPSKGSCSSSVLPLYRPTSLVFHVAMLPLLTYDFIKLAIRPPLRIQLENNCSIDWCLRYSFLRLLIFVFLLFAFVSRWFTLYLIFHYSLDQPHASKRTPVCPRSFSTCSGPWNINPSAPFAIWGLRF